MTTSLQAVYDAFFIKSEEDFTGREEQVFQFLKSAIAKSYKTVRHSLAYTMTNSGMYEGVFNELLDQDEIELIAMYMCAENLRKKIANYDRLKNHIGTKDFNRLPDKVEEYKILLKSKKDLDEEIMDFRQEFYLYDGK